MPDAMIGHDALGNVVVNFGHPAGEVADGQPSDWSHVLFTPDQARAFALAMLQRADDLQGADDAVELGLPTKVRARLRVELRALRQYVNRIALCSDHRDKATGTCIACEAERRTRAEMRDEARRRLEDAMP